MLIFPYIIPSPVMYKDESTSNFVDVHENFCLYLSILRIFRSILLWDHIVMKLNLWSLHSMHHNCILTCELVVTWKNGSLAVDCGQPGITASEIRNPRSLLNSCDVQASCKHNIPLYGIGGRFHFLVQSRISHNSSSTSEFSTCFIKSDNSPHYQAFGNIS